MKNKKNRLLLAPCVCLLLAMALGACSESGEDPNGVLAEAQPGYLPEGVASKTYVDHTNPHIQAFIAQYTPLPNTTLAQRNIEMMIFENRPDRPVFFIPMTTPDTHVSSDLVVSVEDAEKPIFDAYITEWEYKWRNENGFEAISRKRDLVGKVLGEYTVKEDFKKHGNVGARQNSAAGCVVLPFAQLALNSVISLTSWQMAYGSNEAFSFSETDVNGDGLVDYVEYSPLEADCKTVCTECEIYNCYRDRVCRLAFWEDPKGVRKVYEFNCKSACS